jgi:hypothetical protein
MTRRAKPKYRADRSPEPEFWERLSEDEQIDAIVSHHRIRSIKLPDQILHATAHLMVEQQLASGEAPHVVATCERLIREGLTRHDAIHAIAWVLTILINEAAAGEIKENLKPVFEARLEQLTEESWYAAFEDDEDDQYR